MWTQVIEQALNTTRANIRRFGDHIPHVSNGDGKYGLNPNDDWTDGFWTGILWLGYEYSGDPEFHEAAVKSVASFKSRMDNHIVLDHHDIGFLYSLSSKAQWIVEKDEQARAVTIQAADTLMKRWRENIRILQAWGPKDDPQNGGRIIIDCLLNLPLLYWATEQTGNPRYAEVARIHADQSLRFLVRGDGSSYHTFYFDQETGDAIRGGTHQGYRDGSTWTRGQAWGIYGFALAYRYFRDPEYLAAAKRLAEYFIKHLPEDNVAYWDFDVPQDPTSPRDSSASAIAVCGMLEIAEHLDQADPARAKLVEAVQLAMKSLTENCFTAGSETEEGFLRHGSYSVRGGASPDDFVIWGDYYFLEALMRLEKGLPGYWYERT